MSFNGCYFNFDGVPCTEYGLMLYEFGANSGEASNALSVSSEIIEDRLARRYSPLHYGVITNKPLEFTMTFGADISAIDDNTPLDRQDIAAISNWLTTHDKYKWLSIEQPDMELFRYKCFITDLKYIDFGGLPWAFTCKVVCDSPFAYYHPEIFEYEVNGEQRIFLLNKSSYHGFYKPIVEICSSNADFSIRNNTDNNRMFEFNGLPLSSKTIVIDNENEIITCDDMSNPYQYFNFKFLRLCPGLNDLTITGSGTVRIVCEFPVSIGG